MNASADIVSSINEFLSDNIVDKLVVEFLVELKMKILKLDEQKQFKNRTIKEHTPLEILLRSIGKSCFIDCYYQLKMVAKGKVFNASEAIRECSGAKDNSRRTKASVGTRIFKLGLNLEALKSISEAEKVQPAIRKEALKILEEEKR